MTTPEREEKCCEKCGNFIALDGSCALCPCHSPKEEPATCDEPWGCDCGRPSKEEVQKIPYNQLDHIHCWNQGKEPACGIPLEKHEVCCLCGIVQSEDDNKYWDAQLNHVSKLARSLALQEAVAKIRSMKDTTDYTGYQWPPDSEAKKEGYNQALEDAALNIEARIKV